MSYDLGEGLKRSAIRAVKIGLITGALAFVSSVAGILPMDYAFIAPILVSLVGFLEKLERNYRENK